MSELARDSFACPFFLADNRDYFYDLRIITLKLLSIDALRSVMYTVHLHEVRPFVNNIINSFFHVEHMVALQVSSYTTFGEMTALKTYFTSSFSQINKQKISSPKM